MTAPSPDTPAPGALAGNSRVSTITPLRVLSVIAFLLVLFVVFAPQGQNDAGTMYSSYATGAGGLRALYETLGRLGFAVSRNEKSLVSAPDSSSTHVLIEPAQPLTAIEQANLIYAVRHGAVLVFTPSDEDMADSLGFTAASSNGFYTLAQTTVAGGNPAVHETSDPRAAFQAAFPISITVAARKGYHNQAFLWLASGRQADSTHSDSAQRPSLVLGHRVERGYAIAVAPPTIVMNQAIHDPRAAIAIVRAIQFANTSVGRLQPNRVVFDEYHHGFGTHADMTAAVEHALTATPAGRMTLQAIVAALVLLLAYAVRSIAPVSIPPVSRRSPLEHVGALAHAYSRVDARALGTNRLVRGLRRRHPLGLPRSIPDPLYLSALRTRIPAASADVDRIITALAPGSPVSSDHFAATGAAVANIERAFKSD